MMESLQGQLLVAAPTLVDPNFRRTVVLVCVHTPDGALGLVLNRPSTLGAAEAVPQLADALGGDGARLWIGGPVQPADVVLLADFEDAGDALAISGDIGLVTAGEPLDSLGERTRRLRAFLGHSGWGPGQLDAELEREDWIVAPLSAVDPFADETDRLWSTALERLGGAYALLARMPDDPSMN